MSMLDVDSNHKHAEPEKALQEMDVTDVVGTSKIV